MKIKFLALAILSSAILVAFVISCTKNSNPTPPVHDTVTVIKNDTTVKNDTLYATKPDSTVNLTKGLLLYLPFSGNIADSSGNANPTTETANVLTTDAHGYANSAFGATGNGERVYVTNNGSIQFDTSYSLSFDFEVNTSTTQMFLSMADPANAYGPSFVIGTDLPGLPNLSMGAEDITDGCNQVGQTNNQSIADTTSFVPVLGDWYNVVAIYHVGTVKIYVNGTLISTKVGQGTQANLCPASQIMIGAWWNGQALSMNGRLDNVRLYNRQLTPHEIVALASNYQVTSTKVTPGVQTHR